MRQDRISGACCGLVFLFFLLFSPETRGQALYNPAPEKKGVPVFRNLKVLSEESDGKGNIVRIIQYDEGAMRITQTTITPRTLPGGGGLVRFDPQNMIKDSVKIVVNKSRHSLEVFYRMRMVRAYRATFGPAPEQDKCMEGDRCTPEGEFRITRINANSKFNKFLQISYPNDSALTRFNRLKASGIIPSSARIGGDIGIHGIWPGGDNMIELGVGWTDGCVALKNKDIEELYSIVGVGTKVVIRK